MSADPVEVELAEMRKGERRLARRRAMLAMGAAAACTVGGAPIFYWGWNMNQVQAHSEVQFMAPTYAMVIGGFFFGVGAVLALLALVALLLQARSI